jgi:hypothetical protein
LKESNGFNVRPHPGPLPRGEGETVGVSRTLGRHRCGRRLSAVRRKKLTTICIVLTVNNRRITLPAHEPPGSAGVPPASREPKAGPRRRDASAPRNCAPVQAFKARIRSGKALLGGEGRGEGGRNN